MYQLLLVDDEHSIVDSLSLTISWGKVGVTNIFKAYSAYEALDILKKNSIDIVITDIRMPGMSGIELIEEINKNWKHIKCVLLSGFDDFSYAQQAIKFGASDYLLKPVKDEELMNTVKQQVKSLDVESENNTLYQPPTLHQLLDSGLFDRVEKKLASIFNELNTESFSSKEYLYEVFYSITSAFIYIAHKHGKHLSYMIEDDIQKISRTKDFTPEELKSWTFDSLEKIKNVVINEQNDTRFPIIRQVHTFIEENLDKDVSLQKIADHVFLHPVYLSKIYKMETGEGISEFIYKTRMKYASKFLLNSNRKIIDIGTAVGYQNTSYFIRVFKDFFGVTPHEYRNASYKNNVK
ncbi:response regulator [Bacillus sp. IITD106]|nr:response regulator [Bacillus sp. IITD106]